MKLFLEKRITFSDPAIAEEGVVDLSDDLRVERLLEAYSFGIFPWPHEDLPTIWFCPPERGILDFSELHIPKSLERLVKKSPFHCTFNRNFNEVIDACRRAPRPDQSGTWITPKLLRAYKEFHQAGYAHSMECWSGERLVGGLYGVYVAGVFSGESMFHWESNASKICLLQLIEFLREKGVQWIDTQMVTPLLKAFGGKYIPRDEYLKRVEKSKKSAREIQFIL